GPGGAAEVAGPGGAADPSARRAADRAGGPADGARRAAEGAGAGRLADVSRARRLADAAGARLVLVRVLEAAQVGDDDDVVRPSHAHGASQQRHYRQEPTVHADILRDPARSRVVLFPIR